MNGRRLGLSHDLYAYGRYTIVCDVLLQNLSEMEQDGLIEEWTDNLIPSGQNWDEEIKRRLEQTDLFVALVTTPFLASK